MTETILFRVPCADRRGAYLEILDLGGERRGLRIRYALGHVSDLSEVRAWPSALPPEREVLGFGIELDPIGRLYIGGMYVKLVPDCVRQIRRLLPRSIPEPRAESPRSRTTPAEAVDLKPRGVKRQWWLFPFDAYAEIRKWERESETAPGEILDVLPRAIEDSGGLPALGAAIFAALDDRTGSREASLEEVCRVFEHGAAKYRPDNWRRAVDDGRLVEFRREYFSALVRHVMADRAGQLFDTDHVLPDGTEVKGSGLLHLAHAACGCLMMIWHEARSRSGEPASIFRDAPEPEPIPDYFAALERALVDLLSWGL